MDFFLQLKFEVTDLLRLEEKIWHQRSKVHWMVAGNRNTNYFHNQASQKFQRKNITAFRDLNGIMFTGEQNIRFPPHSTRGVWKR